MRPGWVLAKQKARRIGLLRLWYDPAKDEWWISLHNRTYKNVVKLTPEQKARWDELLS